MTDSDESSVAEFLEELRIAGFDLSQPLPVEHYLYFPLASLAHGAAEELRREGYDVDVEEDDERGGWIAYVTRRAQASVGAIVRMREHVSGLAVSRGGEYEGWNAVPDDDASAGGDDVGV